MKLKDDTFLNTIRQNTHKQNTINTLEMYIIFIIHCTFLNIFLYL